MKKRRCTGCHYYKNNMCICNKPKVQNRPFGFPLKFNPHYISCNSYKKREFEFDWDHL